MKKRRLWRITALLLAAVLLTTACRSKFNDTVSDLVQEGNDSLRERVAELVMRAGEKLIATTMSLTKTEGTVNIATKKGKSVPPVEGLKLYDGYDMATQEVSYAWINLDHVKLVKMDEMSEIDIQKKKKDLEVTVRSGSLFFLVTEPLEEEESMNIRTSSMMVGIRGTCGWVNSEDENSAQVYILEGRVTASVPDTGQEVSVAAGETAEIRVSETGSSQISVYDFSAEDIPEFIMEELVEDEALSQEILEASGVDVLNPPAPEETASEDSGNDLSASVLEQYREIIGRASSYDYGTYPSEDTGNYHYALVQMQPEDIVPTLLLKQETKSYVEYVRLFQYDPNTGTIVQPDKTLDEGVGSAGYRGMLTMAWDGNGILATTWSSGTGAADIYRATLDGGTLNKVKLWEGRIDLRPEEYNSMSKAIEWYGTRDFSALESWAANGGSGLN